MAQQINSITLPSTIDRGSFLPIPPEEIKTRADGIPIVQPYSAVDWKWDTMLLTDFVWWCTTLLGGAPGAEFTTAELYNDLGVLTTYTHIIVKRPRHGGFVHSALVKDVSIRLEQLI